MDDLAVAFTFQLAAQVGDVHGKVLRVGPEVVAPDSVVDGAVLEDDALVAHQQFEQVELGLRQLDLALATPDPARCWIDAQVGQLQRLVDRVFLGAGSAQQRANASEQLVEIERLRDRRPDPAFRYGR